MKTPNNQLKTEPVSVDTENLSLADQLKLRMMMAKTKLPSYYMGVYEHYFGKQSEEQSIKIKNCVNLRIGDEEITKNFETMAAERTKKLNAISELAHEINESSFKHKRKELTGKK